MSVRIVVGPDQGDARAVIAAAEIHDDRVVLDCLSVVEPEPTPGMTDSQPARLELHDDVGTEYTPDGGGGSGDETVRRFALTFRPAVPNEATYLRVVMPIGTVVFML
ncbi:MAG: hypothetical protein JST59_13425 [Actinobacteria bacterium]|nr:hypothetical protein [Actinomycetota bacterium]